MSEQKEDSFVTGIKGSIGVIMGLFLVFVVAPCATCGGLATCGTCGAAMGDYENAKTDSEEVQPETTETESQGSSDAIGEKLMEDLVSEHLAFLALNCDEEESEVILSCARSMGKQVDLIVKIANLDPEEGSELAEERGRVLEIAQALQEEQIERLPSMRDAYGPALRDELWESDMEAKTIGHRFDTVWIWGHQFALNRNKRQFHNQNRNVLYWLRFNEARYSTSVEEHRGEWTRFDMDPPSDSDLVLWDGASYEKVDIETLRDDLS